MITLVQFPWSPFCIVQRRILEYSGAKHKILNIPSTDRTLVWRWTRQRYYQVPIIKDGYNVVFETDDDSQVIAKYLDVKFDLGLFPAQWSGVQTIMWRHIEHEIEECCFKLNDIYYQEFVPRSEWLMYLRHKERRFGRYCIDQWRNEQKALYEELERRLQPYEQMLGTRPFLLDQQARFVDFDLFGMLGNLLYSGHYQLPARHNRLRQWHKRMSSLKRQ